MRVDRYRGSTVGGHITLQHLREPANFDPNRLSALLGMSMPPTILFPAGANLDIRFRGTGTPLPSDLILDYVYGIAAFKCWGIEGSREMLQTYYESHYKPVLLTPNPHSGVDDDADYAPDESQQQYSSISRGVEMAAAMDKLNAVVARNFAGRCC